MGKDSPENTGRRRIVSSESWGRVARMSRRQRVVLLGLAVVLLPLIVWVVASPPVLLWSATARERPSAVAGDAVPRITEHPAVRIAVAGDTGTGDSAQRATARRMAAESRNVPYDALVLLGDLVYEDGEARLTDSRVTKPFAPVLDSGAQLLPVLGNHDYRSGEQQQILATLGRQDPWYSQRIGPVRVLVLDSNRVDDPEQNRWLRRTLAEPQPAGTWTLAAMHHPAYSAGYHGSDLQVRDAWGPLFAQAGVRLALAGHDHDYQRSSPQQGVTYVVSGAAARLRDAGSRDFTVVSDATLHYLDLLVYDDRVVGRAIDQSGTLVDLFTLTR
jgi:3',5'-cyclic AMP phosphodiesterase CpdA